MFTKYYEYLANKENHGKFAVIMSSDATVVQVFDEWLDASEYSDNMEESNYIKKIEPIKM